MNIDPNEPFRLAEIPPASPAAQAAHNRAVAEGAAKSRVQVKILEDIFAAPNGGAGHVAGDIAAFDAPHAEQLVQRGLATYDINAGPRPAPRRTELVLGVPTGAAAGEVPLRLLKPWGNLLEGDCAGFNAALARELEVKGIAEPMTMTRPKRTLSMLRDAILGRR